MISISGAVWIVNPALWNLIGTAIGASIGAIICLLLVWCERKGES